MAASWSYLFLLALISLRSNFLCADIYLINGIGTYHVDRENGIIVDNQTGKIAKLSNKPSFMQVVK